MRLLGSGRASRAFPVQSALLLPTLRESGLVGVFFFWEEGFRVAACRVAVFIDYQNCYQLARAAFHKPHDPGQFGNVDPLKLAQLLAGRAAPSFDLTFVGAYCGHADRRRDPRTHSARARQIAAWRRSGVTVFARPLQYIAGLPPREKGVDVKLAVDVVSKAVEDVYDVAILASCDNDLKPAIDALLELRALNGRPVIEVIAWGSRGHNIGRPPGVAVRPVRFEDYQAIQDRTNYTVGSGQATIGAGGSFVRRTTSG
jgi:hypothetical protein